MSKIFKDFSLKKTGKFRMRLGIAVLVVLSAGVSGLFASGGPEAKPAAPAAKTVPAGEGAETAVFAGGCFWGVEGVFEKLRGVRDVVSGYSGGEAATAHYELVGTGTTGHAESVRIVYDPKVITYEALLDVFFSVAHDPTELNFQGPDVGTEYRSVVFYANDGQKDSVENYIKDLEAKKVYKKPIVTEIVPLKAFYPAEDYHQNFLRLNPTHPYIAYWDMPKIRQLEKMFPKMLAEK